MWFDSDNPMFKNMMNNPDLQEQVNKVEQATSNQNERVEKMEKSKVVPKNKTQEYK